MEEPRPQDSAANETEHNEAPPSSQAPPSTSVLSDAPTSEPPEDGPAPDAAVMDPANETAAKPAQESQYSAQTESILKRISENAANAAASGTPGWEAAKEQIMKDMATSDKFPTPTPPRDNNTPVRGGRGGKRASSAGNGIDVKMEGDGSQTTPVVRARGRGGRPRGRGRGSGRGGKRKREDRSDGDSDDSEVYSPAVTMTKSGRNVQKPTSFVPPPQSPPSTNKRKRPYRRNPESAVCKVCLRGTSPASNMIVFCDGCNTPYHRFCHHPPIDQAVVDEVDKEWYCKQCEKERVVPVPEADIASFVAAPGAPIEQRQRYFASLAPGLLVTLLTRATTLKPDLPVFAPDFEARAASSVNTASTPSNGHGNPSGPSQSSTTIPTARPPPPVPPQNHQATAGAQAFEANYMHTPANNFLPEGHPPNYPRPGHGLMRTLPPEQEHLQWLVEEDDRYGVFNHYYQADPQAASAGLNSGLGEMQ